MSRLEGSPSERIADQPILDGVIKFLPRSVSLRPPPFPTELDNYRNSLREKGLIGVYPNGTGHGNVAILAEDGSLIVTATQTQATKYLDQNGYALIPPEADVDQEDVPYEGTQIPSSESRTLLAIARRRPLVTAVVHIHHQEGQQRAIELGIVESAGRYGYGTIGFAHEAIDVVDRIDEDTGAFGTPSHPDGLFFYGRTIDEAYQQTVEYIDRVTLSR